MARGESAPPPTFTLLNQYTGGTRLTLYSMIGLLVSSGKTPTMGVAAASLLQELLHSIRMESTVGNALDSRQVRGPSGLRQPRRE